MKNRHWTFRKGFCKMKADEIYAGDYDELQESKQSSDAKTVIEKLDVHSFEDLKDKLEELRMKLDYNE